MDAIEQCPIVSPEGLNRLLQPKMTTGEWERTLNLFRGFDSSSHGRITGVLLTAIDENDVARILPLLEMYLRSQERVEKKEFSPISYISLHWSMGLRVQCIDNGDGR